MNSDRVERPRCSAQVPGKKGKWLRGAHLKVRSEVPKDLAELIACVRGARTVANSNNTLPRLSAVEIDIVRAQNLKQCDTFSLSDPFVVGYHGGEKIGTTSIVNDTLSPIWSATQRGKALQSGAYAIDARRLHQTRSWVVSFSILSCFGPPRGRRGVSERALS